MTASARGYLHAESPFEPELARLRLLEQRYDVVTRRRLDLAEPLDGAWCLEVGAGAGSVTRMLAERVGPGGHVVAVDLDTRFLDELDHPQVTVRQQDILEKALEVDTFDLVHCRALLCHLSDPVLALRRMIAALRPGGLLLVEDTDYATFAAQPGHPAAATFDSFTRLWFDAFQKACPIDLTFGRVLPGLLADLGLDERGDEALEFRRSGGSPEAECFAVGFELFRDGVLLGPTGDAQQFATVVDALRDPGFAFTDSLNVAAWGRRPVPAYLG